MKKLRAIPAFLCFTALLALPAAGQIQNTWEIESEGQFDMNFRTGLAVITNGVTVRYGGAVLTAESATVNQDTGEVVADGRVRVQRDDQIWAGDHIRYNFKTRMIQSEQFRTGWAPVFAGAQGLSGDMTNRFYYATNAFVTTDDFAVPFEQVRASRIKIVPGEYVEMRRATLYAGGLPVFYFPYYKRKLEPRANRFSFLPGYRSRYGAFFLGSYTWFLDEQLDGTIHLDYRTKRGVGVGPDINAHLERWGEVAARYYYAADQSPGDDLAGNPLPHDRQRVHVSWLASPFTNLTLRSQVSYESDSQVNRDYFEGEYRQNPQPTTFFEATKFWDNFGLDLFVQPRLNSFLDTIERLPEVKLNGWRQQLGASPLYYESESSAGFYRRRYAETNNVAEPDYEAFRGDTYHQILLPWTLFGWLNITPRAGGRLTYYGESHGPGAMFEERERGVFNTGAEVSFKASRTWAGVTNRLLQLDGLRHIVEPSINYVYVPTPNRRPWELPQFDSELPSLRLLPIEFPDYNAIDSVDAQNVMRFGLHNKLQTKRDGQLENLVDWTVFTDWRLRPFEEQTTFSDICSDLTFRPRSWLSLSSEMRYDLDGGLWTMSFHTLTFQPSHVWSWSIGHYYLRDQPSTWGEGNDLVSSAFFYRLNENWAVRATHLFDVREGRMAEQFYTLYRDFRSWTGGLSFRVRENPDGSPDFTVAFAFSFKVAPRFHVGEDAVRSYGLIGG